VVTFAEQLWSLSPSGITGEALAVCGEGPRRSGTCAACRVLVRDVDDDFVGVRRSEGVQRAVWLQRYQTAGVAGVVNNLGNKVEGPVSCGNNVWCGSAALMWMLGGIG
jgi:hypothetical protein